MADPKYNYVTAVNTQVPYNLVPALANNLNPDSNIRILAYNWPVGIYAGNGSVYISNYGNNYVERITDSGLYTPVTFASAVNKPAGVYADPDQNVYVANAGGNNILKITQSGTLSVLAGATDGTKGLVDGTGTAARFFGPTNIVGDARGNLYVADTDNQRVRMITPDGHVTTINNFALSWPAGLAVDPAGGTTLFVSDALSCVIYKLAIN